MKRITSLALALLLSLSLLLSGCLIELDELPPLPGDGQEETGGTVGDGTTGDGETDGGLSGDGTTDEGTTGGNAGDGGQTPGLPTDQIELHNPGANPKPVTPTDMPAYSGDPYVAVRDNIPDFAPSEMVTTSFEYYGPLDALGRCTYTVACIGQDLMPTEERGNLYVKPSGWQSVKYDIVSGKYLYNRCHLIGFQLTGENDNVSNLITGTRYLNIDGMVDFENMVADYIKETGNHVLYRVTPIFVGDELVARGVEMEAYSVEDEGEGICFHVYAYNVQPGITIDYANGNSALAGDPLPPAGEGSGTDTPPEGEGDGTESEDVHDYVLNTNTKKFHYPDCSSADDIKAENRDTYTGTRDELIAQHYEPCGRCDP